MMNSLQDYLSFFNDYPHETYSVDLAEWNHIYNEMLGTYRSGRYNDITLEISISGVRIICSEPEAFRAQKLREYKKCTSERTVSWVNVYRYD